MRNLEKNIFGGIQWIFGARTVDPVFLTVQRYNLNVFDRLMSVFDSFGPYVTFLRPEKFRNGKERSGTARNGKRSETFAKSRSRFKNERITVCLSLTLIRMP
jgi:hypothetical protein